MIWEFTYEDGTISIVETTEAINILFALSLRTDLEREHLEAIVKAEIVKD